MCNFSKGIYDDGRLKGKLETILELMAAQNISVEAACDMLRYSTETKEKIVQLIEANR